MTFDLNDITIGIPSYNTPDITLMCLKAIAHYHLDWQPKLIVSENSTDTKTSDLLDSNEIPYIKSPGSRHSPSVQSMMEACKTRYFLHLDSDAIIRGKISKILGSFVEQDIVLGGEYQGSRGGYELHPRIAPYFCFMDLKKIKENGCVFHDEGRIIESGSEGFFANVPIQKNQGRRYYDCGSILFEDCLKKDLKIGVISSETTSVFVTHYEGCSWRTSSGIPGYIQWGSEVNKRFFEETKYLQNVDIRGKFLKGF